MKNPQPWLSIKKRYLALRSHGFRCAFCGSTNDLTIDHLVPKSHGGNDDLDNLVPACQPCNTGKANNELTDVEVAAARDRAELARLREQVKTIDVFPWVSVLDGLPDPQKRGLLVTMTPPRPDPDGPDRTYVSQATWERSNGEWVFVVDGVIEYPWKPGSTCYWLRAWREMPHAYRTEMNREQAEVLLQSNLEKRVTRGDGVFYGADPLGGFFETTFDLVLCVDSIPEGSYRVAARKVKRKA